MKTFKLFSKSIGLFFSILILFQGCTVYKSTTIQKAVQGESKVKVITTYGETLIFTKVEIENGNYYGLSRSEGELKKVNLHENYISKIKEKDKTLSTIFNIGIPIILLGFAISSMEGKGGLGKSNRLSSGSN